MAEQLEVNSSTDLLNDFLSQGEDSIEPPKNDIIIDGGITETETITPANDTLDITNDLPDDLDIDSVEGDEVVTDDTVETEVTSTDSQYSFKALASVLSEEGLIDFEDSAELEDTPEVLFNSIKNTVAKEVQTYKDSIPEKAKQIIEFMEKGGSLDDYLNNAQKPFDIKNIDLTVESEQEKVVREYLKLQDYSPEEIEDTIKDYSESLILEKQAKVAAKQIDKYFDKKEQALLEQAEIENQARVEQYNTYINTISSTIDTADTLAGLPITAAEKTELKKYILARDKEGLTPYERDYAEDPIKTQLELAFLKYKKFDFSKAVKAGETQATQKFKDIFKNSETNIKTGKSVGETKTSSLSAFEQFKNSRNK